MILIVIYVDVKYKDNNNKDSNNNNNNNNNNKDNQLSKDSLIKSGSSNFWVDKINSM